MQHVAGWDSALPFYSQVQALPPRPHCPRWPPMTFYNYLDKGISIPCTGGETGPERKDTYKFPSRTWKPGCGPWGRLCSTLSWAGWAPGGCREQGLAGAQSSLRASRGAHFQTSGAAAGETVGAAPPAAPSPCHFPLCRPGHPQEHPPALEPLPPDLSLSRSPALLWVHVP